MEMNKRFTEIYLKNGERYVVEKGHNDDLYEIKNNHFYLHDMKKVGKFIFKKWVDFETDLGEIASMRAWGTINEETNKG